MPRILGVDYGLKRIGLAVSDADARIASPLRVLRGRGSARADAEAVAAVAAELDASEFVVGLPLHMNGREGEQSRVTRAFVAALEALGVGPVHLWDERLTSHAADRLLDTHGVSRAKRKAAQDAMAAYVILAGYLETRPHDEPGAP